MPKSPGVRTRPAPKWCCQTRLTMTRAVSGFEGSTIARANSNRPLPWTNGFRSRGVIADKNWRGTVSPNRCGLPRTKTRGSKVSPSLSTIARGGDPGPPISHCSTSFKTFWYSPCDARSGNNDRNPQPKMSGTLAGAASPYNSIRSSSSSGSSKLIGAGRLRITASRNADCHLR